jgi:prophage tail gpP-like protein
LTPSTSLDPALVVFDPITVELDGVAFRNWETLRLSRELNAACGTFEISATLSRPWPAKAGAKARILLGDQLAATGYVDGVRLQLTSSGHTVTVTGRDKTSDLVDCSVPPTVGQLSNVHLLDIAIELGRPYGVEEDVRENGDVFPTYTPNQGESAWSALEKAARLRGKLCFATPQGKLRIDRPGAQRASGTIREGEGDLELRWENTDKFRTYIVRGQGRGTDNGWGESVAAVHAESFDQSIKRPRTLVVIAESAVDTTTAQERADWERTVRWARSASFVATVRGWRQKWGGPLWELNQLVAVKVPRWGFEADLLVDSLEFSRGDDGTRTTLRLVRADSYTPEPGGQKGDPFAEWATKGKSAAEDSDEDP